MKLLLVEDEQFAREGLLSMISKEHLGITEIITAIDGNDGLQKATKFQPDIILTDVRMPIIDGITMVFKIRDFLPDCCVIFMSGYSDKDYLKSAIQLSAVNYIEKPFQPQELYSTLQVAIAKCQQKTSIALKRTELNQKLTISIPVIKNEIAQILTRPCQQDSKLQQLLNIVWPDFSFSGSWITFLIALLPESDQLNNKTNSFVSSTICDLLYSQFALSEFANVIIGQKNESLILVHLNLLNHNGDNIPVSEIGNICYMLRDFLKSTCRFLLATGQPANSIFQLYTSYQTASICLQRGFFHKENAVLFYEETHKHPVYQFSDHCTKEFEKALYHHKEKEAYIFIKTLVSTLRNYDGTLVSSVKNYFLELLKLLYFVDEALGHPAFSDMNIPDHFSDIIWHTKFLTEIEDYILNKLAIFFAYTDDHYTKYPLAYQIRTYLNENFYNEDLSLHLLSEHFSVSESYACIIFKKAFDQTINQYIIQLRLDKAKEYLLYSNKKIREISELVGYSDCNYFIRLFKKNTGITPADYRQP